MKFTDGYWHMRPGITPHFPIHVHDEGPLVHVQARGAAKPWRVLLRGVSAIQSVTGGAVGDALGTLLTPKPGASGLIVRLASYASSAHEI